MKDRLAWKRYYEPVRLILLRDWDPIGVSHHTDAQDEYDSYALKTCGMLMRHESRQRLIDYLFRMETVEMGLSVASREHVEKVVDRLIQLREEKERQQTQ